MLAICPVPVPEIGDGFALLMLENGFYSVTDTRTGLKVGNSYKTRSRTLERDRKSTRLNSSHSDRSRMPSSA